MSPQLPLPDAAIVQKSEGETGMTTTESATHRTSTPGHEGWPRVATPGAPNKYFMVSADCHVNEPPNLWVERIEPEYRNRLPRIEVDAHGVRWSVVEGYKPQKLRDLKM